jgi:hypothetical protein
MTPTRYSILAASLAALLLSACGSGDKPAAKEETAAAAPKVPAPAAFNVALCLNDHCGLVDQAGGMLVPFENDYDSFSSFVMHETALVKKNEQWQLLDAKTKAPIKMLDGDVYNAVPGYFGFERDGKVGLMDYKGNEVQAPRFDQLYTGGEDQYIGFDIGEKRGLLDTHGKLLAEALYDSAEVRDDFDQRGGLVAAERGETRWVIDLKNGAQKEVPYERLGKLYDGHMVASVVLANKSGLADASGALAIPLKYEWLGEPGEGLVAFREKGDSCGYMDYQGKVVIEPRFISCHAFGKKGAFVKEHTADGGVGKAGFIDRSGAWIVQPTYADVGEAEHSVLGMIGYVPGYNAIYKETGPLSYDVGLFDTNQGRELLAPGFQQVGVLTPDRLLFSPKNAPMLDFSFLGQANKVPAVGLMDAGGKVLLKPERFINLTLDKSGRYIVGTDGAERPREALYDLDGKELIAPQWHKLVVDLENAVVFGYEVEGMGDDEVRHLKAAYDLAGKPLFVVKRTECGAEQLVDGAGKTVWPQDPKPYCAADAGKAG